jgi:SpoIID/LytB domain protein
MLRRAWTATAVAVLVVMLLSGTVAAEDPSPTPPASPSPSEPASPSPSVAPSDSPDPSSSPSPAPSDSPTPSPTPSDSPLSSPTPSPTPTPWPTGPTTLGATVAFRGSGNGHGVGLSQYGTLGRALAGETADAILAHYYQGTTLSSIDPATPIRILVLNAYRATSTAPLVAVGLGGPWTITGFSSPFAAGTKLSVRPPLAGTSGWRLTVTNALGVRLASTTRTGRFRLTPSPGGRIELKSKPSYYDEYRGVLRIQPASGRLMVVNEVPLDDYLRGVVPVEMPKTWPAAALQAQTIAARSYAGYRLRPETDSYDTVDDTRSQVYRGYLAERGATNAAIAATAGVVLRSGTSIINAMFHSTGGGATEHNENAFVSATGAKVAGPVSYLRGSADIDALGVPYDAASPYASWTTKAYSRATLSTWFASDPRTNVGTLAALDLGNRGVSGRVIKITLIGSLGTKTVSGDVFRAIFNARKPVADPILRSNELFLLP